MNSPRTLSAFVFSISVITAYLLYDRPSELADNKIDRTQSGLDRSLGERAEIEVDPPQDSGENPSKVVSLRDRYLDAALADESIHWLSDGLKGEQRLLLNGDRFANPILVRERLVRRSLGSEPEIVSSVAMEANTILLQLQAEYDESFLPPILELLEAMSYERISKEGLFLITLGSAKIETLDQAQDVLKSELPLEIMAYCEPNYIVFASLLSNDPSLQDGSLWGLRNTGGDGGLAGIDIDADAGWDIRTDASDVIIGVIDTGVDYDHEDLRANIWVNSNEIPNNGIDDDENGYVDDVHGINAIVDSGDPMDYHGHGTHVAGTIGATGNNGVGVSGVAWNATIMPLKFLSSSGSGSSSDAIKCIDYAIANGARITSNSWGGGGRSTSLYESIKRAESAGLLFVAAAGNDGSNTDESPHFPSAYDLDSIVSVASIQRDGVLSLFSNYGLDSVDIAAPGSDILSTWNLEDEVYKSISGTSMATPHVSGVLALLLAEYPSDSSLKQKQRLLGTARGLDSLVGKVGSQGMVNLSRGLRAVDVPFPPVFTNRLKPIRDEKLGSEIELQVEVDSSSFVSYQWYFEGVAIAEEIFPTLSLSDLKSSDAGSYTIEASNEDGSALSSTRLEVFDFEPLISSALDAESIRFYPYGAARWDSYALDVVKGESSLRSGPLFDDESIGLFFELQGPGELSFSWRVSSESFDVASLYQDGASIAEIWGETGWRKVSASLEESRIYRFDLRYEKDWSTARGDDRLYVDSFAFLPLGERPPRITNDLQSITVAPGESFELSIDAVGDGLTYQWYLDGSPMSGRTSKVLSITNADQGDSGDYHAVVSNSFGSEASGAARVGVAELPVSIIEHPRDGVIEVASYHVLTVSVEGTIPIDYQWYKDGLPIVGADSKRLEIVGATPSDAGVYHVEAGNRFSSSPAVSNAAKILLREIDLKPKFYKQPASGNAENGSSFTFSAGAQGAQPISYQWYLNDQAIAGKTSDALTLSDVELDDAGEYYVVAENYNGEARSFTAELIVHGNIGDAVEQPDWEFETDDSGYVFSQSEVTFDGEDALETRPFGFIGTTGFRTTVEGPGNFSFYWAKDQGGFGFEFIEFYVDDVLVDTRRVEEWGRSGAWLSEGSHALRWVDIGGGGWLDQFELEQAPVLLSQTGNLPLAIGSSTELEIEAIGGSLSYQWFKNGELVPGATSSKLLIEDFSASGESVYHATVSSLSGEIRSDDISITAIDSINDVIGGEGLVFQLSSAEKWVVQSEVTFRDGIAFESGASTMDVFFGFNWIETSVEGPIKVFFDWKKDNVYLCDNALKVEIDGELVYEFGSGIGGEGDFDGWRRELIAVPEGAHTVRLIHEGLCFFAPDPIRIWLDNFNATEGPVVLSQPSERSGTEGKLFSLAIDTDANDSYRYQWRKDGEELPGQVSRNLEISKPTKNDAGQYDCIVMDTEDRQVITSEIAVTFEADFEVAVSGDGSFISATHAANWTSSNSESWNGDGAIMFDMGGGMKTSEIVYEVSNDEYSNLDESFSPSPFSIHLKAELAPGDYVDISLDDAFKLRIDSSQEWTRILLPSDTYKPHRLSWKISRSGSDPDQSTRIWIDNLHAFAPPKISSQSTSALHSFGSEPILRVDAYGLQPMRFQWQRNGEAVSGETQPEYPLPRLMSNEVKVYELSISNDDGDLSSEAISIGLLAIDPGEALEAPGLEWAMDRGNEWLEDKSVYRTGDSSLSLAMNLPDSGNRLEAIVDGPAWVSFYWKFSPGSSSSRLLFTAFDQSEFRASEVLDEQADWTRVEFFAEERGTRLVWELDSAEPVSNSKIAWIDNLRVRRDGEYLYDDWALEVFGAARDFDDGVSGPFDDPDGDGLENYTEFALRLDPFSSSRLPNVYFDSANGVSIAAVNFDKVVSSPELSYQLETSDDLSTWFGVLPIGIDLLDSVNEHYDTVRLLSRLPVGSEKTRFARLVIRFNQLDSSEPKPMAKPTRNSDEVE